MTVRCHVHNCPNRAELCTRTCLQHQLAGVLEPKRGPGRPGHIKHELGCTCTKCDRERLRRLRWKWAHLLDEYWRELGYEREKAAA